MIRSEELIDELVATLHFHNYLQMGSANIFGGGPLNVVANDHKKENIQGYIDDLFIDYFFRTHDFKPIDIPKNWKVQKYTKEGSHNCDGGLELNLRDPFDRYTFVDMVSNSILNRWGCLIKQFPQNHFLIDMMIISKNYGPIWEYPEIRFGKPFGNEFEQYLNILFGMKHSMYKPLYRAQDIFNYSEWYQSDENFYYYQGLSKECQLILHRRQRGYREIKDIDLFGDYTLEDILMIYCLLVYKFKMTEHNLLSFIGLFVHENEHEDTFLNQFREFENQTRDMDCIKPFVRDRDLFLRFTSPTKSKAVKFKFLGNGIAEIQFFNEEPIQTVSTNNSLPLPFLYNELY